MDSAGLTMLNDIQEGRHAMLSREQIRELALGAKDRKGLTWPALGKAMDRSPVYAAMLVYGYGQATAQPRPRR